MLEDWGGDAFVVFARFGFLVGGEKHGKGGVCMNSMEVGFLDGLLQLRWLSIIVGFYM